MLDMSVSLREFGDVLGCPFFGFRWPERTPTLRYVGGDECGLDLDRNSPCLMKAEGVPVNYFVCPVALRRKSFLDAAAQLITFDSGQQRETLEEWKTRDRLGR